MSKVTKIDDGGPAFPLFKKDSCYDVGNTGMTALAICIAALKARKEMDHG